MDRVKVLVAGVGNIFLGDDAFGCEVARRLMAKPQREGVRVVDYGIRGFDLAYGIEHADAAILIDIVPRGVAPGTLCVVEPGDAPEHAASPEPHAMTPNRVLDFIQGAKRPSYVRIVGCEPATFGEEGLGQMGLSAEVERSIDAAVQVVEQLLGELEAEAPRA